MRGAAPRAVVQWLYAQLLPGCLPQVTPHAAAASLLVSLLTMTTVDCLTICMLCFSTVCMSHSMTVCYVGSILHHWQQQQLAALILVCMHSAQLHICTSVQYLDCHYLEDLVE